MRYDGRIEGGWVVASIELKRAYEFHILYIYLHIFIYLYLSVIIV